MSRFLSSKFSGISPYTPGEQPQDRTFIKLNTNECPYPPSPRVVEAVSREEVEKLRLYSDPEVGPLTKAIAERCGLRPDQVLVGNGSDEILAFSFLAFNEPDKPVRFPNISYGFYKVYVQLYGLSSEVMPLKEDFTLDLQDYVGCGRNVVIANPNAPTGIALSAAEVETIVKSNRDNVVIIDEAYVDFGGETVIPLIDKYDNLLVVQTFSKSRSLAGGRIGFAAGNSHLIEDLNKMKFSFNPYNINRLSMLAGKAAVEDVEYFERCRRSIMENREWIVKKLAAMGFATLPSKANFIFANPVALSGEHYFKALREKGILVRHFSDPLISSFVRITIGSKEEMEALLTATKEIFAEAGLNEEKRSGI